MTTPADSHRLNHVIHWALLGGSVVSSLLLLAGLVLLFASGNPLPMEGDPALGDMLKVIRTGSGLGLIDLGLLVLIFTPVLRVALLALGWGLEGYWRFALIAVTVLVLLGIGIFLGAS